MSKFTEKVSYNRGFELCGRMLLDNEDLVIFIDNLGKFVISSSTVRMILMGLGKSSISGPISGCARLSESGKGFYLDIGNDQYVAPVSRVWTVLSGIHRKGPVSRVGQASLI